MAPTITAPNARATARYQHVSPYKVRQVLDLVRGLSVDDAERTLQLCEKDAADDVLKVLESAIATPSTTSSCRPTSSTSRSRSPTRDRPANGASRVRAAGTSGSGSARRTSP